MATEFRLDLAWTPARGDDACRYVFTLTNIGAASITGFSLGWSGPARIDPAVPIEGGRLLRRLSNATEVAPPAGFVLHPGESWQFTIRGVSKPLRHWTDAAQAAFVVPANGTPLPVSVSICTLGDEAPGVARLGLWRDGADGGLPDGLAVIPRPRQVQLEGRVEPPVALALSGGSPEADDAIGAFATLTELLFPDEALVAATGFPIRLMQGAQGPDSYSLRFADGVAEIAAGTSGGFLYGLVTLGQILRAARHDPARCRFPRAGLITDAPRFGWRGAHLDVARQFYAMGELRRLLAIMAWNKLNRFHLHLTEDEAWRWEVAAYPELTRIGAWRGHGLPLPPLLGSGAARTGGSYSRTDLRELVALAARLNIEIMPEVDVPGHSFAAVIALPWLRDPGENMEYQSVQGFPNNCLSPAVPRTMAFVETLFRELVEIFPARWVHVGADEVPEDAWAGSPLARKRLTELSQRGAAALQADFLKQVQAMLRGAGRITGAWEEGAHGGGILPPDALMFAWRDTRIGGQLAAAGYDVVVTPGQAYYLDMALGPAWWEPGASWAGWSSVENTYRFDPATGFADTDLDRLHGVQACIWSEPMSDRRVFERLVFPRLSAVAESAWTPPRGKSWQRFAASASFMPTLYG